MIFMLFLYKKKSKTFFFFLPTFVQTLKNTETFKKKQDIYFFWPQKGFNLISSRSFILYKYCSLACKEDETNGYGGF